MSSIGSECEEIASEIIGEDVEEERTWGGKEYGEKNLRREKSRWARYYLGRNPMYPAEMFCIVFCDPRDLLFKLLRDLYRFFETNRIPALIVSGRLGYGVQ